MAKSRHLAKITAENHGFCDLCDFVIFCCTYPIPIPTLTHSCARPHHYLHIKNASNILHIVKCICIEWYSNKAYKSITKCNSEKR